MTFNEVLNLSIYYFNTSINFKEFPEPTEEDMPVVYYLYCETLFLTFQAINISKNWIGNLIKAALWLPMAGLLEITSQIWIGKNKSIKIKIPQAPKISSFLKNNATPNKTSNKPDKYIIAIVKGKKDGTKGM